MKKLFSFLVFLILFSACSTTQVPPGQTEGRVYLHRDPATCEVVRFVCEEGYQPFFDDWGCGCERVGVSQDQDVPEPSGSVVAVEGDACGLIGGQTVQCEEGTFCASVDWISSEPRQRCVPLSICSDSMCGAESECVILESWPAQVKCVSAGDSADVPEDAIAPVPVPSQNESHPDPNLPPLEHEDVESAEDQELPGFTEGGVTQEEMGEAPMPQESSDTDPSTGQIPQILPVVPDPFPAE